MHSHSLAEYMTYVARGDWPRVGEFMLSSANKLAKVDADFLIVLPPLSTLPGLTV
jgi:hypothetical protein